VCIVTQTATNSVKLIIKLHGQGSRTVDLAQDHFSIGRKADNDLVIDDHTVSGHHAKIVKIQSVYFLEDLKSTNGTVVNAKSIERAQLHDADVISIGQHRLIFQESGRVTAVNSASVVCEMDKTMVIRGKEPRGGQPGSIATILVNSGKTECSEYHLTKPASLIGAQKGAAIRLTGWFSPKSAALITCRSGIYNICPSRGIKKLLLNGVEVTGPRGIKNGDVIEVAGVTMTFHLVPPQGT
jgi:pSer/pThr/pTyr-binding forkhead associated (FHA) protein